MSTAAELVIQNETLVFALHSTDASAYEYRLLDKHRGILFADLDYGYEVTVKCDGGTVTCPPESRRVTQPDEQSLLIEGTFRTPGLRFTHRFSFTSGNRFLNEEITLHNDGDVTVELTGFNFGLRKMMLRQTGGWAPDMDRLKLASLPTRRYVSQTIDRRLTEYSAHDLVYQNWTPNNAIPGYAAEGWAWHDDTGGLLILKYHVREMEFSRFALDARKLPGRGLVDLAVRFGGAALYRGDPEGAAQLAPHSSYAFGVTRYTTFEGDYREACYLYRSHLVENGHGLPPDYDPPVHWNELYNLGWFAEQRKSLLGEGHFRLYSREDLLREAQLARSVGAEALYLDPGWDTFPGSCVWDAARLGPLEDFVSELRHRFGLKLSLELMMSFDSETEVEAFYVRDEHGARVPPPRSIKLFDACTNEVWVREKSRRLLELGRAGVAFFMFDFTYHAPCQDRDHGHAVPRTRQAHAEGLLAVVQAVKREFPDLLIELHDRVSAGVGDYHPAYYQHGLPHSYDENWGFEYMWFPMQDLVSHKALSLYDYNLAYPIPLYLHINANSDNPRMLLFWWYASVARHLGIGGVTPEHPNYEPLRQAMALYLPLKARFTRGVFHGLDPLIHLHVDPETGSGVITAYNLSGEARIVTVVVPFAPYGLTFDAIALTDGTGHPLEPVSLHHDHGSFLSLEVEIPSLAPVVVQLNRA